MFLATFTYPTPFYVDYDAVSSSTLFLFSIIPSSSPFLRLSPPLLHLRSSRRYIYRLELKSPRLSDRTLQPPRQLLGQRPSPKSTRKNLSTIHLERLPRQRTTPKHPLTPLVIFLMLFPFDYLPRVKHPPPPPPPPTLSLSPYNTLFYIDKTYPLR